MKMKYLLLALTLNLLILFVYFFENIKNWYEFNVYKENCIMHLNKFGKDTLLGKEAPEIFNNFSYEKILNNQKNNLKENKNICECKSKKLKSVEANIFFSKLKIDDNFKKYEKQIHWKFFSYYSNLFD